MDIWQHCREALTNLLTAKLRSFLAILGILVGTGSVVALITSSEMATQHALSSFKTLGTNILAVNIQSPQQSDMTAFVRKKKLTLADMATIKAATPAIQLIAPYTTVYQSINFKGQSIDAETIGATSALAPVVKLKIADGRFVSDFDGNNFFCVIGDQIAKQLKTLGVVNPIGTQLQLNKNFFTVIGVAEPWQTNLFIFADLNQSLIIPIQTSFLLSKYAEIQNILLRLDKGANMIQAQQKIQTTLQNLLPGDQIDFRSPKQIINIMVKQRSTFTWLLGTIGGISLLVGAIGVMNIMLVSVVERKREIGIRMAIGARRSDIRWMFLIESMTLTVFGGILGVIIGLVTAIIISYVSGWGFYFNGLPVVLGFAVSVLVGIVSGLYPAIRASRLDPIDCLQIS